MGREEQLEEIAKERNEIKDIMKLLDKCVSLNPMYKAEVATVVYANNYRKIPEDSVVLSREEHEILVKTAQGKIGNMKATDFLKACISSGVMVEAVSTKEQVQQAVKEFAEMLIEDFIKSADNQEFSTVKGVMKNVCPAKVNKIRKRFEKEYEK